MFTSLLRRGWAGRVRLHLSPPLRMLAFEVIKYVGTGGLLGVKTSDKFGWIFFIFTSRGNNQSNVDYVVHSRGYFKARIGHSGQVKESEHSHAWVAVKEFILSSEFLCNQRIQLSLLAAHIPRRRVGRRHSCVLIREFHRAYGCFCRF